MNEKKYANPKRVTKRYDERWMRVKVFREDEGVFMAVVSVFSNVDLAGDRVMPGAFKNTLKQWRRSGAKIPVIFSHSWLDRYDAFRIGKGKQNKSRDSFCGMQILISV